MALVMHTYLVVLVYSPHPMIALFLGYNLSCVFDDDLIWLKSTVGTNPIATISCFDDFDPNIIFPTSFAALTEVFETAISTVFRGNVTISVITLVKHEPVKTVLIAP